MPKYHTFAVAWTTGDNAAGQHLTIAPTQKQARRACPVYQGQTLHSLPLSRAPRWVYEHPQVIHLIDPREKDNHTTADGTQEGCDCALFP